MAHNYLVVVSHKFKNAAIIKSNAEGLAQIGALIDSIKTHISRYREDKIQKNNKGDPVGGHGHTFTS